jgi:hypothetical protein
MALTDVRSISDDGAVVSIAAGPMVTAVLGRIIGVFAARASCRSTGSTTPS